MAENKGTHYGHDLRDLQLEDHIRQLFQAGSVGVDGQMRNNKKSGCRRKKCSTHRRSIGKNHCHAKHNRGVFAKARDGRGDKAKDDQRYTEGDDLTQDIFDGNGDIENCHGNSVGAVLIQNQTGKNAQEYSNKKFKRQVFEKRCFFHWKNLLGSIK